jgi:hypothetical protein
MASARTRPVEDSVPKVADDLAVGEDLDFQHRWWCFEAVIWIVFAVILALDLSGLLGRGPLAKASAKTPDGTMKIDYERVERFQTPSVMTIYFGPNAVAHGQIQLWVSEGVIKPLGNQRIIPQPQISVLNGDGILYTWPTTAHPNTVAFALNPSTPGEQTFTIRLTATGDTITRHVFVMP